VERIRAQGPMPFAAFMQTALYHPRHGYYAAGGTRTGWRGDYLTAPEVDPAFGELWAKAFEQVWEACGRPGLFSIVEIGPGEGGFALAALGSMSGPFAEAVRYRLVERSGANEERQRRLLDGFTKISWHRSIQEVPTSEAGCSFANEVLDNLPVHLVERQGGRLLEVCVELGEDGLIPTLRPPGNPELQRFLDLCGVQLAEGHRYEIGLAAISLVAHTTSRSRRGASFFVDYGASAAELADRPGGSLLCYSGSGSDDLPLQRPGDKDITVHANWTALTLALRQNGHSVVGPFPQREVLKSLGLDGLHAVLRSEWDRATAAGEGAAALRALSRRQAISVLSDEAGLGGFGVVAGLRGIETPTFLRRVKREEAGPRPASFEME
jgi:SAM-dependent MidA family methyltransferase